MLIFKQQKKAQASIEFLMTYGWAMLALVAIAGVFIYIAPQTKSITSNKCVFSPATPCLGTELTDTEFKVALRNNLGQTIYDLQANMTYPINNDCTVSLTNLKAEERVTITCDNTVTKLKPDSKIRMSLTYKKVRNGYDQISLGDIYAK